MPELPEVEILARQLRQHVVGKEVSHVEAFAGQRLGVGHELLGQLVGQRVVGVRRFGKRISLDFSNGLSLLTHLMLVGQWRYSALTSEPPPEPRLTLVFSDGSRLYLSGTALQHQRLLRSEEVATQEEVAKLGPDPLLEGLSAEQLERVVGRRNAAIKAVLLEQEAVGGIGNTYADEALYLARINPRRPASSLSSEELARLASAVRTVMEEAIAYGGSSEMAFVHLDGRKGQYQEHFRVKEREGQPCERCGTRIVKVKVAGRPTYYCPSCQPE